MGRGKYQSYASEVKAAIVASRNPRLFPHLMIPKSTSQHWIRNGIATQCGTEVKPIGAHDEAVAALALVIKCLGDEINLKVLSSLERDILRKMVVSRPNPIGNYLRSELRNKLRRSLLPCAKSIDGKCVRQFSSQLTGSEVAIMKRLVTASRYAHMSISSLSLFAVREGFLFCSIHTWYKYISQNKWVRPHAKRKVPQRIRGLRAKMSHEIWHIDVSHVVTTSGEKFYLQVILDNFSRYVIAWSLRDKIRASDTERLIKRARRAVQLVLKESLLISDGGSENVAKRVTDAIAKFEPKLVRRIARKEIRNGNTMVEIFFKMLKNNHLYFASLNSRRDLVREISFYVNQHNNVVPMRALNGNTPAEALYSQDNKISSDVVAKKLAERRSFRIMENRSSVCQICL